VGKASWPIGSPALGPNLTKLLRDLLSLTQTVVAVNIKHIGTTISDRHTANQAISVRKLITQIDF